MESFMEVGQGHRIGAVAPKGKKIKNNQRDGVCKMDRRDGK
jgi:hypothetical protein